MGFKPISLVYINQLNNCCILYYYSKLTMQINKVRNQLSIVKFAAVALRIRTGFILANMHH